MTRRKFPAMISARLMAGLVLAAFAVISLPACQKEAPGQKTEAREKPAPVKPEAKAPVPAGDVQEPLVAGSFYPADPAELRRMIRGFLDQARPPALPGRIFGFQVPHAGCRFSGPVAACCYKLIEGSGKKRFVIMGPSHHVPFQGVYVLDKDQYQTPLGNVAIDRESVRRLASARPWISTDPRLYQEEHSAEVQVPFLQEAAGHDISVVVMIIGRINADMARDLAGVLEWAFPGNDAIFLASSDMSHGNYAPYKSSDQIRPVDLHTLDLVKAMDIDGIAQGLAENSTPLCGGLPVLTLMNLFKIHGGKEAHLLKYADSGDATGNHQGVVGYGAVAFMLEGDSASGGAASDQAEKPAGSGFALSEKDKIELLKMARTCVNAAVRGEPVPEFETDSENLRRIGAAFVTLKNTGRLRGCIGTIMANEPLYQCVRRRAVDAAIRDSRFFFNPIKPEELGKIEVEISVLTPPERVAGPEDIEVGRDGVLLSLGPYRGVFLPQVPGEQGWDREQYLSQLCGKAGISDPACFRRSDAVLERFQAIVFSEHEFQP